MTVNAGSSKVDGEKRAVEEGDEARATDEEAPIPGKSTKKKKVQHKVE